MAKIGMAFQQGLSFLLLRVPKSEAIFWPGCALMKLDPEILEKTTEVLRREEPELRMAAGCCGQPTVYLFSEKWGARREKLVKILRKQGVKRIYTACPNCTLQMGELAEAVPIWEPLARNLREDDLPKTPGAFVWHDPCPIRHDPSQRKAVRTLMELAGCDYTEPGRIRCCGNVRMLRSTDPEKSAAIRRRRLAELDESRTIASCCDGCLDAFRTEGRDTCHLLEILFGRSKGRSWGNRIMNTKKAPF